MPKEARSLASVKTLPRYGFELSYSVFLTDNITSAFMKLFIIYAAHRLLGRLLGGRRPAQRPNRFVCPLIQPNPSDFPLVDSRNLGQWGSPAEDRKQSVPRDRGRRAKERWAYSRWSL